MINATDPAKMKTMLSGPTPVDMPPIQTIPVGLNGEDVICLEVEQVTLGTITPPEGKEGSFMTALVVTHPSLPFGLFAYFTSDELREYAEGMIEAANRLDEDNAERSTKQ